MRSFSSRNGYRNDSLRLEYASPQLKKRIMSAFFEEEYEADVVISMAADTTAIENMMVEMGVPYQFPTDKMFKQKNAEALQDYVLNANSWFVIYDFIEKYIWSLVEHSQNDAERMVRRFNSILEDEVSAYRILDWKVVPITSKEELETIDGAINNPYDSVQTHIGKALSLFSDRKKPDYENSIKESISAIESMCCIITESEGKSTTLGKTLKRLKDNEIYIHPAMESAFSSLYGYTSDANGIRHGGIDFRDAPTEDAKYMLVTCSAFINYLMEKWRKVKDCRGKNE